MKSRFHLSILLAITAITYSGIAASDNSIASRAKSVGISKCLPTITAISDFIVKKDDHGAISTWSKERPDKQMFNSIIETNSSANVEVIDLTVAPVIANECAASYTKIVYYQKSCLATAKEYFDQWEYKGSINKQVAHLTNGKQVDAYLMNAGSGCIFIKKEILLNGAD